MFNIACNNSTLWDYYMKNNYTDIRCIVSDTCNIKDYALEVEAYFDEEERNGRLSSFLNSLYWDCKRFEIELAAVYFKFGFISEAEYKKYIAKNERYM